MLLELLITLASGLLVAISTIVLAKILSDRWALIRAKKMTRGLPILPGNHLVGNHILTLFVGRQNCETLRRAHEQLGGSICLLKGSEIAVSTTDLDLIKTITVDEPNAHLDRCALNVPMEEYEKSIMLAPAEEWRQLRKAIAPALAPNKFKAPNVVAEIEASIKNVIDHIERQLQAPGERRNLFDWDKLAHKFSLDLVFRCFYKQQDLIAFDDPKDPWTETLDKHLGLVLESNFLKASLVFPALTPALDWIIWYFTPHGVTRHKILSFVKSQAVMSLEAKRQFKELELEAKQRGVKLDPNNFTMRDGRQFKRNMVDHIIDQFHEGRISKSQYLNNACFLLGAADKTACDCLVHTVYLLATNQRVQTKARQSVRVEGAESEYLEWVLKESLRLMPPAPVGCTRTVTRDFELQGGHLLPAGSIVITNAYTIHRLKKYWGEDADEFKPERWSDTSQHHPMQFMAFGAGARGCPGRQFAMFEMKMLLAALLKRYEFGGEPRDDVYMFDAPFFVYVLPYSPTEVLIKRVNDQS